MSADPISHVRVLAQRNPLANRLRAYGDDLLTAKAMIHDLTHLLKRLDEEAAALTEQGLTMTVTLGPVGDAAAATRRDMEKPNTRQFTLPGREAT